MKKLFFLAIACCLAMFATAEEHLVYLNIAHVSKKITPTSTKTYTSPTKLPYATTIEYICEGQDTIVLRSNIYPKKEASKNFTYFWQTRKDNETEWVKKGSAGTCTKTTFNNALANDTCVQVSTQWSFEYADAPDSARFFRLCMVNETDTSFSNIVEINPRYRMTFMGPVCSATNASFDGYKSNRTGESPLSFGTHSQEVAKNDTIFLDVLGPESCGSYCDMKTGGVVILANDGRRRCMTGFENSSTIDLTPLAVTHTMTFYVNGELYKTFSNILCDWKPSDYGCTLEDPEGDFLGKWQVRGTTSKDDQYTAEEILDIELVSDRVFDAIMDEKYDLWVAGVQVTRANCEDILGDKSVNYGDNLHLLNIAKDLTCTSDYAIKSKIRNLTINFPNDSKRPYITLSNTGNAAILLMDTTTIIDGTAYPTDTFVATISNTTSLSTSLGAAIELRGNAQLTFYDFHGKIEGKAAAIVGASKGENTVQFLPNTFIAHTYVTLANTEEGGRPMWYINNVVLDDCVYADAQVTYEDLGSSLGNGFKKGGETYDATVFGPLLIQTPITPTAIGVVEMDATKAQKIMVDDVVYILHGDKVYNLQGIECELPCK